MSRKISRTYGKFYGIFTRILGKAGGVNIKEQNEDSKKAYKTKETNGPKVQAQAPTGFGSQEATRATGLIQRLKP